jgi:hypothetical protein
MILRLKLSPLHCQYFHHKLFDIPPQLFVEESESESDITTDSQVGQFILEYSTHLGPTTRYLFVFDNYAPVFVGVLSNERTGLTFVYAAGIRQRSLSWVPVPLDS